MRCGQCGKQAIIKYEFGLLCVDCNFKFQQTNDIVTSRLERQINYLSDEIDKVFGVGRIGPRFPERKAPVLHTGNVSIKPVILNNSVVGNINQGTVSSLNANLQNIRIMNESYAEKIKGFIEKVAVEEQLTQEQREDVAAKVDYLAQQLNSQTKNRPVIKTVTLSVATFIQISSNLATLWAALSPIFLK